MKRLISCVLLCLLVVSSFSCGTEKKETDNSVTKEETDSEKTIETDGTPIQYTGGFLNMDVLGISYEENAVVVVDKKSQLEPYCQEISKVLTSEIETLQKNSSYIVSYKWFSAMDRFSSAVHFFEDRCTSAFFLNNKILFVKSSVSYTDASVITDVRLVDDGKAKKLHVDIIHLLSTGFSSDAATSVTLWLAVPSDLDINYEQDLVINHHSGYDPYCSPSGGGYLNKDYTVRQWGWLRYTENDNG